LSSQAWQALIADLIKIANDAAVLSPVEEPLAHQHLAVELPLTLAYLFPELPPCRDLARAAQKLWSWGAEEITDGEGLLPGRHLHLTGPLLACWTRTILLARQLPLGVEEDVQMQLEWLLRQTLRLLRDDGSLAFAEPGKVNSQRELIATALTLIDDPEDHALAKAAFKGGPELPPKEKKSRKKRKAALSLPEPFAYSEWSAAGVLRGDWTLGAPRLAVTFDERRVTTELSSGGTTLLSGEWQVEIGIDGWTWKPEDDWNEVCFHADEDVVYLELETKFADSWRLQRQMLLARRDRFLLLADAILGETPANLSYRSVLPLGRGIQFLPADETREGHLAGKRSQALVLPLALPEWRSQAGGELSSRNDALTLTQSQTGRRMFAPLLIDLKSERLRKDCTWRQLTVVEHLQIQPPDVAAAYRAQVGKEQWSIYRSLAPKGHRTYLGHNIVTECQVAKFLKDGTAEVLLEIE
jgi:hypothetical protein